MGNNRDRKFYHRKARPSYQRHHEEMQELALERIEDLFARAWQIRNSDPELANRYIMHIRKLSMATKVRIPLTLKRNICHHCKRLLIPGINLRLRIHHRLHYGTYVSATCLNCGHIVRYLVKGSAFTPVSTTDDLKRQQLESVNKNQDLQNTENLQEE